MLSLVVTADSMLMHVVAVTLKKPFEAWLISGLKPSALRLFTCDNAFCSDLKLPVIMLYRPDSAGAGAGEQEPEQWREQARL